MCCILVNSLLGQIGTIDPKKASVSNRVSLTVKIGNNLVKKQIVLGLFGSVTPKTVNNFVKICGNKSKKFGRKLISFNHSNFHRVIPNFMLQGGDFTKGDGTGGVDWNSGQFKDENFKVRMGTGVVAMANSGPNTNGSQFFITTMSPDWLNGHHVVFGRVLTGMPTVRKVERKGSQDGTPSQRITIQSCRVLNVKTTGKQ